MGFKSRTFGSAKLTIAMPLTKTFETTAEVMEAVSVVRSVKLTIEYGCPIEDLNVPNVLEKLREDGAAEIVHTNQDGTDVGLVIEYHCDTERLDVQDLLDHLRESGSAQVVEAVGCREKLR